MTSLPRLVLLALGLLFVLPVGAQSLKDFQRLSKQSPLEKLPLVGIVGSGVNSITYRLKNTTSGGISFECPTGQTVPALYWEQQQPNGKWYGYTPGEGLITSERSGLNAGESVDFTVPIDPSLAPARAYLRIFNATGSKSSFIMLCEIVK